MRLRFSKHSTFAAHAASAVTCALLMFGCATPQSQGSHCIVDAGYLDNQSTYYWKTAEPVVVYDETGYVSPTITKMLEQAAVMELANKGFVLTDREADRLENHVDIALTLSTRREVSTLIIDGQPCYRGDCWDRIEAGSVTRMEARTIGFLSADVYYDGVPIWRGWVERELHPSDRDNAGQVIALALPALFESFPP